MAAPMERLVERIWARDHTVWKPEPTEIVDRLGWLDVMESMRARVDDLRRFADEVAREGFTTAVLLGMGGSSLAPEVFRETLGARMLDLVVLDTTHPAAVARVDASLDPERTLFLVASKSGTTIETMSHLAYFSAKAPATSFVAITDPGTPLAERARADGFRAVFENPPDIGGRYSALSLFGLVPAALLGADLDRLLSSARAMAEACRTPSVADNPGASLGAAMGEAAMAGRDKLTITLPPGVEALGVWIEQLIAESTGKEGRGIVPIVDEPLGDRDEFGTDRFFVAYGDAESCGDDAFRLPACTADDLGAELFRWEFATAAASAVLGVHPFDQPDVELAKKAARAALDGAPAGDGSRDAAPEDDDLVELLGTVKEADYVAIQAYVDPTPGHAKELADARRGLRAARRCATTLGFGPRYLHSTGQLHKGGPDTVVAIQILDVDGVPDVPIPGVPYTFGELIRAQALGDLRALRERGRRVARVSSLEM